ncbi:hypothetical protein E2K80_06665 [Rhodophyticola sp. CCM32]|uniref:hypothetical protein n=1 Tax=Rhodophyticola sp. CCM32 TaxID=2916397 RepID=UPI00107FC0A7|nr:hypothetical protein [Rhodophyticola sp. CCM32]QBY00456.1 hypothetical protein E2K80_06665 [Rhodophyticola sp. CCM32]
MAAAIFGDSIAYGDVRVYDRGAIGLPLSITAPNGNIYYPERLSAYYSDDFSAPGVHPLAKGVFMHEMGHVWQNHQGVNVVRERNFNNDYDYSDKLNNSVPFGEWGIEEQAEYLADVYRAQNGYSLGRAVNQSYTLEELLTVDTGIPNLQALVDSSSAPTSSLRPVPRPEYCFLHDSKVQMWPLDPSIKPRLDGSYDEELVLSKVWYKRQDQMQAGDLVVSYDKRGRLQPGRVTRTMTNSSTHILDFWGTGTTPGHAYHCADGPLGCDAGRYLPRQRMGADRHTDARAGQLGGLQSQQHDEAVKAKAEHPACLRQPPGCAHSQKPGTSAPHMRRPRLPRHL